MWIRVNGRPTHTKGMCDSGDPMLSLCVTPVYRYTYTHIHISYMSINTATPTSVYLVIIFGYHHVYTSLTHIYIYMSVTYTCVQLLNMLSLCAHWHPSCAVHRAGCEVMWCSIRILAHFAHMIWDCVKSEWSIDWMRAALTLLDQ